MSLNNEMGSDRLEGKTALCQKQLQVCLTEADTTSRRSQFTNPSGRCLTSVLGADDQVDRIRWTRKVQTRAFIGSAWWTHRGRSSEDGVWGFPSGPVVLFRPVAQSRPTLGDPVGCSTPGSPVHRQLLELAQTHVRQVGYGLCSNAEVRVQSLVGKLTTPDAAGCSQHFF